MPTIPGLEAINWGASVGQAIYWVGIIIVGIIILMIFGIAYYFMSFDINATVIPMYGSGKDGVFSIGTPKKNKVKWINHRTAWRSLHPLFNKFEREPFDSEYIYPGKRIYIFEFNNEWSPGRINIEHKEDEIRSKISLVPHHARNWQSLQHKKHAIEFAKPGFWEQNKAIIMTLTVALFCCILVIGTIYFTYKYAAGGRADAQLIASSINNLVNMAGGAPG